MKYIYFIGCLCLLRMWNLRKVGHKKVVNSNTLQDDCLDLFHAEEWVRTLDCLDQLPDSSRDQAYYDLKGSALMRSGQKNEAIVAFRKALDLDVKGENPYLFFKYGESLWLDHHFTLAGIAMEDYLRIVNNPNPSTRNRAEYFIRSAHLADSLYQHPREFDLVLLSDSINTADDELGISMTYDRRNIILTRRSNQEDLFQSHLKDGKWSKSIPISLLNTPDNEGAAAISGDGSLLVFTACQRPYGVGSCDLYFSTQKDTGWSRPELLPGVNSRNWDSQPTLSPDGRAIIFSSERPGGFGGKDLWLSVLGENGWIDPINLGSSINSPGNEENPFLHSDEFTLYFTSDYRPGFGGRDLFMAHRIRGNEWSSPQNLGYPVNSLQNEEGIFVESSGLKGYFSSARDGQSDIYTFQVDPAIRPKRAWLYEMTVLDSITNNALEGVSIKVYDWASNHLVRTITTDADGYGAFIMRGSREYGITLSAVDHVFYSYRKQIKEELQKDFIDTIQLAPAREGKTMILENVHFATGEARLLEASFAELDQLTRYLTLNKKLVILLTGHTDNVGQAEDNQLLSEARAEAVKSYLVNKGVEGNRIRVIGKGESQPIVSNETSAGRQKNRRTEFTITQ